MRNKIIFLLTVLVLSSLLAACGPSTVTIQPQPAQRTLTVTEICVWPGWIGTVAGTEAPPPPPMP